MTFTELLLSINNFLKKVFVFPYFPVECLHKCSTRVRGCRYSVVRCAVGRVHESKVCGCRVCGYKVFVGEGRGS